MDKTVNQYILEMYDNFSAYAKEHILRECAEHIYPDWEIKRMSDTMLVVVATIENVEYRVRISKVCCNVNVQVTTWELD